MGNFESSKTLSGIGAILLLIPFLNIVGLILLLMGIKDLSEYYKDYSIYKNALTGGIFSVIGSIISYFAMSRLFNLFFTFYYTPFYAFSLSVILIVVFTVVSFVFQLLAAINFRNAFNTLSDRTGVQLFHTTGTLLFIGAILSIIVIGGLLVLLAYILLSVAFFTLRTDTNTPTYNYTPPPTTQPPTATSTTNTGANFCPNCGVTVSSESAFCAHCGKRSLT